MKKLFNILITVLFSFLITAVTGSWSRIYASPSFVTQEGESTDTSEEQTEEEEKQSGYEYEEESSSEEQGGESEEKSEETEDYRW